MEQKFIKYINEFSQNLIDIGFRIKTELNEEQSYMIEYSSNNFIIKIEKYFREFYVSLYKTNEPDKGIELFNLLEYLKRNDTDVPKPGNFLKEKDIEECYRKQFEEISRMFFANYEAINAFFGVDNFDKRFADMRKYRQNKYPELYKKS